MHIVSMLKTFSLCVLFSFIFFTKEGQAAEISPLSIQIPVRAEDTEIHGVGTPNDYVYVFVNNIRVATTSPTWGTIIDADGNWTLNFLADELQTGETVFVKTKTDVNGNGNYTDDPVHEISAVITVEGEIVVENIIINRGRTHIFPTNGQIQINNGESCASMREVTLKISAQNASEVVISNDQNFVGTNWENFSEELTKTWTLSEGDGTKTIYTQFRSLTGDTTSTLSVNILLDEERKCGEKNSPVETTEEMETTNTNASIPVLGEEIEVLGETIEVPEEKMCSMVCSEMNYILYIINPDGSQRLMGTEYTRTETMLDGRKRIKFEDSGFIDQDFNDLWILVDDKNCENLTFTLEQVSARWIHRVGVYILQNNAKKMDVQLWADSHREATTTKQINAKESKELCMALSGGNPLAAPFVTLYDDTDYNGRFASFNADVENLRVSAPFLNDKTQSIKLSTDAKALLYQDSAYQNTSEMLEKSVLNLDLTTIGNNTLSSLKILSTT